MDYTATVQPYRPPLDVILTADLTPTKNRGHLRGEAVEAYVRAWLRRAPSFSIDENFPRETRSHYFNPEHGNIVVYKQKDGTHAHEFDLLGHLRGIPVGVEVKAGSLKGFREKIPRALGLLRELYHEQGHLLVFNPGEGRRRAGKDPRPSFANEYQEVDWVDSAYRKKELNECLERLVQLRPELLLTEAQQ